MSARLGRNEWNRHAAAHGGSLLQSWEWGELQEALGRKVVRHAADDFLASTVEYPLPLEKSYRYVPHGPVFMKQPSAEVFAKCRETLTADVLAGTIFLKIEPQLPETSEVAIMLRHAGFRRVKDTQPSETRYLDLTKPEPELLKEMEYKRRNHIRAAGHRGVTIAIARTLEEKMHAFDAFWDLFETTNVRHGLHAYDKRYYELVATLQGDCYTELYLALAEGDTIAAAAVAYFGKRAYYLYAASRAGYGKYNAPSLLLFEIIRRAKTKQCTTLDLWGSSETKKEWAGVTAFKKSFGGVPVTFVGTWDYVYRPLWYRAYQLGAKFR